MSDMRSRFRKASPALVFATVVCFGPLATVTDIHGQTTKEESKTTEDVKKARVFLGSVGSDAAIQSFNVRQMFQFKIDPRTAPGDLLPIPPDYAQRFGPVTGDDLALVPEITFQKPFAHTLGTQKTRELIALGVAKINHLNTKKTDAFMQVLLDERADLAGLPMAMGDACRMSGERSRHFNQALTTLRRHLGQQPTGQQTLLRTGKLAADESQVRELQLRRIHAMREALDAKSKDNAELAKRMEMEVRALQRAASTAETASAGAGQRDAAENFWLQYQTACVQEDKTNTHSDAKHQEHALLARIAALMQVLAPESAALREGLVKYLGTIAHPEATRALASLAMHSPEEDIHRAAVAALKVRRERDYTDILVQGLRYPWPATAKRAADALVKLERKDLIPQLLTVLEQPDPRLPVVKTVDSKKVPVVRELVRINHHRNCLMCHAPGNTSNVSADVVTASMPVPGEPMVPTPQGYDNGTPDMLVRVDVTYLRQDFSMRQAVADAHPWPEMQRFDFLVRSRQVSEDEAQAFRDKLTPREAGVLSPYHRVALAALRDLTGRDTEPNAPAWRRLLKMDRN